MELQTAHLLVGVVSDFWYLQNSASCFEIIVIFGRKTRFLGYRLLRFKDIQYWRPPKDAPCWAAYFTYKNTKLSDQYLWLSSDGSHKKSLICDGVRPLPHTPMQPAGSKPGMVANIRHRATQWHRGFRNPRAAKCQRHTKCSWIDSDITEVKNKGWNGLDNSHYNGNEEK